MKAAMRAFFVLFGLLTGAAFSAQAQSEIQTAQTHAQLVTETTSVQPGGTLWVALDLSIKKGWHTYWRTPGDSGLPARIDWSLPAGMSAGPIQYPTPERIPYAGLMNFGYQDHVTLLTALKVDPTVAPGDATLKAAATWLVCADVCIPEDASFSLPVKISPQPPEQNGTAAAIFAAARAALPQAAPWPVKVTRAGDVLHVTAGPGVPDNIQSAAYFPYHDSLIVNVAPQNVRADHGELTLSIATDKDSAKVADGDGVLVTTDRDGHRTGYSFAAPIVWTGPASASADVSFALALAFAFLGGIILNVMPCVLPVLAMKALSFLAQGAQQAKDRRRDALAYTAGVIVAFTLLVGALIGLRAAGSAIGWGFQLQSPVFVAVLAYVMLALGLNLSGVFAIGRTVGIGQSLASRPGVTGAFFTGLLAVIVATPCTVPFMGTAVGFALTQSPLTSIAVFWVLGFGLAFPYLLFAFIPGAARILPRPGRWMERLRQVLAFPLYGAAAWMVWVFAQQVDPIGLAIGLAGAVIVGFAAWLAGIAQDAEARGRTMSRAAAGVAAIAVIALVASLAARPPVQTHTAAGNAGEAFSTAKLDRLRAAGQPVFVDFTAAWCLTCIVNERVALSQPAVADAIKAHNVAFLKADWTNRNPDITAALHALGRDGVPLYALYGPRDQAPKILPQLLTPEMVVNALNGL